MISCVFRVRLMEDEKRCPFDAFTMSHLKGPVIVSFLSSCPTFNDPSHSPTSLSRTQSAQSPLFPVRFVSILSACFLVVFTVRSNEIPSCDVTNAHSTKACRQFHSVQSSPLNDLSTSFSQIPFVFASSFSGRGFIFLGFTTFASKSRALGIDFEVMSHNASDFLESKCNCVITSTCPANSDASSNRREASDASSSSSSSTQSPPFQEPQFLS